MASSNIGSIGMMKHCGLRVGYVGLWAEALEAGCLDPGNRPASFSIRVLMPLAVFGRPAYVENLACGLHVMMPFIFVFAV